MIDQEHTRHERSKITHEARQRMQAKSAQEQLVDAMRESREAVILTADTTAVYTPKPTN